MGNMTNSAILIVRDLAIQNLKNSNAHGFKFVWWEGIMMLENGKLAKISFYKTSVISQISLFWGGKSNEI